jgi:hypothetical protein
MRPDLSVVILVYRRGGIICCPLESMGRASA